MRSRLIALLAFASLPAGWGAELPVQLTTPGYQHFYNLEYDRALADFSAEVERDPSAPDGYNHIAQALLFQAMLRGGALESNLVSDTNSFFRRPRLAMAQDAENRMLGCIAQAMTLSEARLKKNPKDLPALYALGVAYGLRSDYDFLVRKAWIDTLRDATAARKLHNRITEIDPNFIDALLLEGLHDYILGNLIFPWKQIGFIGGFHGDKLTGTRTLRLVSQKGQVTRVDAAIFLGAILRRDHRSAEAVPIAQELIEWFPRNYIARLELAQLYGDLGDKQKALSVVADIAEMQHRRSPGYESLSDEKVRFLRGDLLFRFGDLDAALSDLRAAAAGQDPGERHMTATAWLRVGQIYDLKGQRQQATDAYRAALRTLPDSDVAAEAKSYLANPYHR